MHVGHRFFYWSRSKVLCAWQRMNDYGHVDPIMAINYLQVLVLDETVTRNLHHSDITSFEVI